MEGARVEGTGETVDINGIGPKRIWYRNPIRSDGSLYMSDEIRL